MRVSMKVLQALVFCAAVLFLTSRPEPALAWCPSIDACEDCSYSIQGGWCDWCSETDGMNCCEAICCWWNWETYERECTIAWWHWCHCTM